MDQQKDGRGPPPLRTSADGWGSALYQSSRIGLRQPGQGPGLLPASGEERPRVVETSASLSAITRIAAMAICGLSRKTLSTSR
jgi:hypothetical protein